MLKGIVRKTAIVFACLSLTAWASQAFAQFQVAPNQVPQSSPGVGSDEPASPQPPATPQELATNPRQSAQPQPKRASTPRKQSAQAQASSAYDRLVEQANNHTVSVVSGTVNGSYIQLANDMSFVLDDPNKLRILPVIGRGGYENIYDVLLIRGIDLGLVRSDAVEIAKREGRIPDLAQRLAYIAPLTNDELHIVASKSITSIDQLKGKRVNFDLKGSGSDLSGRLVFERLGVNVQASNLDSATAYAMVAKGELEAAVFMSLKPVRTIANIPAAANLHLLEVPYDKRLEDSYYPATFDGKDYANLVGADKTVPTIAAKTILVTYNWQPGSERYLRVQKFVDAFFSKIDGFKTPPRHPKWQEVNLAATFQGLPRFKPAKDWLERNAALASADDKTRGQFQQFLEQRPASQRASQPASTASDRDKLFNEFVRWQRTQQP
jgi:uncharacterized protein